MLTEKDYCDWRTVKDLESLGMNVYTKVKGIDVLKSVLLYEAQKWLREKKLLHIVIDKLLYGAYEFSVVDILNYSEEKNGTANSYEKALSEGIKEAVKILKE